MNYKIYPPDGILEATIAMPLSKSVSNRQLIISALTPGGSTIDAIADCSDTQVIAKALNSDDETIDCHDAGTAMRFLTAYFATQQGREVTLTGTERMLKRPVAPLVKALRECGADITYIGEEGFPPLHIKGCKLSADNLEIDSTVSSQFISALLMIAPLMTGGMKLRMDGEPVSLPYIDLTLSIMRKAGINCERAGVDIEVAEGSYSPTTFEGEGDWSAATFWLEIEALSGAFLSLSGLDPDSYQPDRKALDLFGQLGAVIDTDPEEDIEGTIPFTGSPDVSPRLTWDFASTPDMAPAVAVTCAMIGVPFTLTGLESLVIKESDRLTAIAAELRKIGVVCTRTGDHTLQWDGRRMPVTERPVFETYNDHRMAMALAPVSLYIPGIVVKDIEVVSKSYPEYWDHFRQAGFQIIDADAKIDEEEENDDE